MQILSFEKDFKVLKVQSFSIPDNCRLDDVKSVSLAGMQKEKSHLIYQK